MKKVPGRNENVAKTLPKIELSSVGKEIFEQMKTGGYVSADDQQQLRDEVLKLINITGAELFLDHSPERQAWKTAALAYTGAIVEVLEARFYAR